MLIPICCLRWKDLLPLYSYLPTEAKAQRKRALDTIKNNVYEVIDKKMHEAQDVNAEGMIWYYFNISFFPYYNSAIKVTTLLYLAGTSLLDILLSLRDEETNQGLSRKELYDQVVTFMFAGHEVISIDTIRSAIVHSKLVLYRM